jgi:hypothetical protein
VLQSNRERRNALFHDEGNQDKKEEVRGGGGGLSHTTGQKGKEGLKETCGLATIKG